MRTADTPNGYGWISIGFHWATAAIVFAINRDGTFDKMMTASGDRHDRLAAASQSKAKV